MRSVIRALIWEQAGKNWIVFPILVVLLIAGTVLTYAQIHAATGVWWAGFARGTAAVTFFTSLLLGFAPFTLMESHSGWRMNSMVTRWFVLPVHTGLLVLVPFLIACVSMALLIVLWTPVLSILFQGFDTTYFLMVLLFGVAAIQMVAWILPRRPSQYWPVAGLLFPSILLLGILPQEGPNWGERRWEMLQVIVPLIPALALTGFYAAGRNRCGDWPGEIPLDQLRRLLPEDRSRMSDFESPTAALFWSDTFNVVRTFCLSWLVFALVLIASQCALLHVHRRDIALSPRVVTFVAQEVLPPMAVFWLWVGGLWIGCEPGAGFRTRLSSFRAVCPVSVGTLAAQRVATAAIIWLIVWLPLLGLCCWYDNEFVEAGPAHVDRALASAAARMAVSAHVLVGALPLFLWGRLEGFPNMVLCAMVGWLGPWFLTQCLDKGEGVADPWAIALGWLTVKVAVATWALTRSWRAGYITWRFAAGLVCGWLVVTGLLIWALPTWRLGGAWPAVEIALLMPLARVALCPLAVAANRHR